MILESDIECLSKAIHVVILERKNEITIGRRVNNDITVSDISVSRQQAIMKVKDGKIFIEDGDSKFGTFVKVRGPLQLNLNTKYPL